jgi:cystathionine beta-lyase/cystathionine gamma-synthase
MSVQEDDVNDAEEQSDTDRTWAFLTFVLSKPKAVVDLEKAMCRLYETTATCLTSSVQLATSIAIRSGMTGSATSIALVHDRTVRRDVRELLDTIVRDAGVDRVLRHELDFVNAQTLVADFKRRISSSRCVVLFAEACSNPHGNVFDFGALQELKRSYHALTVVIDDSWTTVAGCNALSRGADLVVSSLSDHYSANAVAMGGMIVGNQEDIPMQRAIRWCNANNVCIDGYAAHHVHASLPTYAARYIKAGTAASKIVTRLRIDGVQIDYPMMQNGPSQSIANRYLLAWPPTFMIWRRHIDRRTFFAAVAKMDDFEVTNALGGLCNAISRWLTIERSETAVLLGVRVSIGYAGCDVIDVARLSELILGLAMMNENVVAKVRRNER